MAQTPGSKEIIQTLNATSGALGRREEASWSGQEGSPPHPEELSEAFTL